MVKKHLQAPSTGISYEEDLGLSHPCGKGTISGRVTTHKGKFIALFTFSEPVSDDTFNAAVQLGGNVIGLQEDGVRRNLKDANEIIILLALGTRLQRVCAAQRFRDKIIDWCNTFPDGSDTARKREQSETMT